MNSMKCALLPRYMYLMYMPVVECENHHGCWIWWTYCLLLYTRCDSHVVAIHQGDTCTPHWHQQLVPLHQVGLGVAVDQLLTLGIDRVWQRIQYLAEELRARLRRVSGVLVHDHGAVLCGIVTFTKVLCCNSWGTRGYLRIVREYLLGDTWDTRGFLGY